LKPGDRKLFIIILFYLSATAFCLLHSSIALAVEEMTPGRRLWDNILLWVNFGILVFFFLKFARKPLMVFLRRTGDEIKKTLNSISAQREEAKSTMEAEAEKLERIEENLEEIRNRILEMGRREKKMIVEQGRVVADKMIKDAKEYAGHRLSAARKMLSDEMVEIAISMVQTRLSKGITEKDDDKIIKQFVADLANKDHLHTS